MDMQLLGILKDYPRLLSVINDTVQGEYRRAHELSLGSMNDPLFACRHGYTYYLLVESAVRRVIEEQNYVGINAVCVNNGTSNHLEIITPYATLMIARTKKQGGIPRKVNYRQRFVEQIFFKEACPDLELFNKSCHALYVITHCLSKDSTAILHIGRLCVDQRSWSCNYEFNALQKYCDDTEKIAYVDNATIREEIVRTNKIRLKNG